MKRKLAFFAVALGLSFGGVAWALGWFRGEDAEVAALREDFESRDQMSETERDEFRGRVQSLSDDQRKQLFGPLRQARQADMQARLQTLLSMNERERRAELDNMINEMEQRRRAGEGFRPGFGGPPRGDRSAGEMNQAQRAQRGKARLDRSTPEMRATMTQMMKMINERREERGMEPIGPPR